MKIKRFKNLWTMGLIIFGALLVGFYVLKIVCPQFIVGVAETPSIVRIGNFIDSNIISFSIYHFIVSYIGGYLYCCACCRNKKLNLYQNIILITFILICIISQIFFPQAIIFLNYSTFIVAPLLMLLVEKRLCKKELIPVISCFLIDTISQYLSIIIRDVTSLTNHINSATMTILIIDGMIWRFLLYSFFNNKSKEN
jgi:hypothetical protein